MDIRKQLDSILNKQMDRKGFIRHLAFGVIALIGGGVLLRLSSQQGDDPGHHSHQGGYGDTAYGGVKQHDGERV